MKMMNKTIYYKNNFLLHIYIYIKMPNLFKKLSNNASNLFTKIDNGASNFFNKTAPNIGNKIGFKYSKYW